MNENGSIPLLMNKLGEAEFRLLESKYLKIVFEKQNVLVSTGGGTPCFFDNMNNINANGTSIYLEMDEKSLTNRLVNNTESRPLIKGKNKKELLDFIKSHLKERRTY
jgi:shikimate kinase